MQENENILNNFFNLMNVRGNLLKKTGIFYETLYKALTRSFISKLNLKHLRYLQYQFILALLFYCNYVLFESKYFSLEENKVSTGNFSY